MVLVPPERITAYRQAGWWGDATLWSLFAAQVAAQPDAEAVVDAPNRASFAPGTPQRWSWARLHAEVQAFGALLLQAGLQRDQVIVVQLPNTVEQFMVYLACARLGIIVSPVPVAHREHELTQILAQTEAAAVVTFEHIGRHAAGAMARSLAPQVITLNAPRPAGQIPDGWPLPMADEVFTICWTSGTEAQPKGVPRSHNEWLIVAPSIIEAAGLAPGARLLNPFPLVNMAGLSTAFSAWLTLGGTVVQHHPFVLPVFLQQLRDERIDYTVAPPAVLTQLLQNEALLDGIDFQRLARIGSGSAPLSDWMVRGFAERHGVQIVNYYGSNEGAALSGGVHDMPDPALRAVYFPRSGVAGYDWHVSTTRKIRTRLVDPDTEEDIVVSGVPGELRFTGPTIFSGYWRAPAQSERAFDAQGFYRTGDLFEIGGERQQYYRYVGRLKDLVIRGGMNISSEEIENLLQGCPGVQEAAVVGVPDAVLGERVCACIVAAEGAEPTLADITQYLRDQRRIAVYKLPEALLRLPALPRNPVGKILKRDLRTLARTEAVAA
jgi:acyl-CoA synthetase (AMP-forming)/AMP-acid ligase II